MSEYALALLFSGIIPFILSFYPGLKFYRKPLALIYSILIIVIIFGSWDCWATWRGHWSFNPKGIGSLRIINLPLEEWFFFVVIPFCCIFTWETVKFFRSKFK
jgi:lycopene cyclase domain-containing protein